MQNYLTPRAAFTAYSPVYKAEITYDSNELFTLTEVARHEIPLVKLEVVTIRQPSRIRKTTVDLPDYCADRKRSYRYLYK